MAKKITATQKDKKSYKQKALDLFQSRVGQIVHARELAQITGKDGFPINHNMRRIFELRDEDGYEIVNHKDNEVTHLGLKVDEWVLLKPNPNPKNIRTRGVNKRISFEVFTRDNYRCRFCGKTQSDDDPFKPGHKLTLQVGHIIAHKRINGGEYLRVESIDNIENTKVLTAEDFITLCNVCNEGAKNNDLKLMSLKDMVNAAPEDEQKEILQELSAKYN